MTSLIQNIYRDGCEGAKTGLLFGVCAVGAVTVSSVAVHLIEVFNRALGNRPLSPLIPEECKMAPFRDLKGGCENYLYFELSISFAGPILATTTLVGAVGGALQGVAKTFHR